MDRVIAPLAGPSESRLATGTRLPSPVDVLADWFKSVPPGVDLQRAALSAIAQIDRRAPSHPDAVLLRTMLAAFAGDRVAPTR